MELQTAVLKPHGRYRQLFKVPQRVYTDFQEALEKILLALMAVEHYV
jgi:hypothetical protein